MNAHHYRQTLWNEHIKKPLKSDLLSMMARSEATKHGFGNFLGNLMLLIVGGNEITCNTLSGSIHALAKGPNHYKKLRDSFVPGVIRWRIPLAHMRCTALEDIEFKGKQVKKGDKVVIRLGQPRRRGGREPYDLIIDLKQPRVHLSFASASIAA